MEVLMPDGSWNAIGAPVTQRTACGSISSEVPSGRRRVFLFGWIRGRAGVWRSRLGLDVEVDDKRAIASADLVQVSNLSEPFAMTITRPHFGQIRVRFSLGESW
jgi:hypothetical protein